MATKHTWVNCIWTGTNDPEILKTFDCYKIKIPYGWLYLRVYHNVYSGPRSTELVDLRNRTKYVFTSSCGPNSDNSWTGCLAQEHNELSLEEAQTRCYNETLGRNRPCY